MSRSRAEAALAQLGEKLGIPGLALNASGVCQLVFEQRWVTTLVHDAALHRIVLHCPLCAAPQTQTLSANTLRGLLQASFMGQECGGGHLALAPDGSICLQLGVAISDADEMLAQALETLLNQAERWAARLQAGDAAPAPAMPAWAIHKV